MSVKRTKRRIKVDLVDGVGREEKQAIRDIFNIQNMHTTLRQMIPLAARDQKRQEGTKKKRRIDIDAWMDRQLDRDPSAKSPELWAEAPLWISDQIGFDRFRKRVTEARKRRK